MPDDGYSPLFALSQRLPPQNVEAEQAVLGALLANNKAYDRVAEFLKPEHFADALHGRVYEAIARRIEAGHLVDAVTLKSEFADVDDGSAFLAHLMASAIGGLIGVAEYGHAIHDAWVRRQMIDIAAEAVDDVYAGAVPGSEVVTEVVQRCLGLSERAEERKAVDHAAALDAAVAQAEAAYRRVPGRGRLDTGIPTVDALWRGMWPNELYFVMARSRTGKTPFLMQLARGVARQILDEGVPGCVHIFSLEMDRDGIARLGLTAEGRWDADQLKSGEIGDAAAWKELSELRGRLAALPIVIDDTPDLTLPDLALRARVVARQKHTRLIGIDFRQLIKRPRDYARMPTVEWLPMLSNQLKVLARTLGVPVICLEQINKSADNRESSRPTLGDLPYGGDPAADSVFALWRPELTMGDEPPKQPATLSNEKAAQLDAAWWTLRDKAKGVAEFIACKRRGGATGFKRLRFDGPRQLFREIEAAPAPQPDMLDWPTSESIYGP